MTKKNLYIPASSSHVSSLCHGFKPNANNSPSFAANIRESHKKSTKKCKRFLRRIKNDTQLNIYSGFLSDMEKLCPN